MCTTCEERENTVDIELPWNYLDPTLRADAELSFAFEMMEEIVRETGTARDVKESEWLTCILRGFADYVSADDLCTAWNTVAGEIHTELDPNNIRPASETETALKLELINTQQQAATMREELAATRLALRIIRHACAGSKAKDITAALKRTADVA
jgi:hypothetical protein